MTLSLNQKIVQLPSCTTRRQIIVLEYELAWAERRVVLGMMSGQMKLELTEALSERKTQEQS